jgi:hypothetical protein
MDKGSAGIWSVRFDLLSVKLLVWTVSIGRDAELTPATHLYFSNCYQQLANHHRLRGHTSKASRLYAKASEHYRAGGGSDPPFAAAMAMPRPRQWIVTDAVGRDRVDGPDDAA